MSTEQLKLSPIPVNRVAQRVVKKAAPEDVWSPMPKRVDKGVNPGDILRTAPVPKNSQGIAAVIGKRRDRMTVIGYAADQGSKAKPARWVVRCDCGNFEHRRSVLKWLSTKAPDMCRECRDRSFKKTGCWPGTGLKPERVELDFCRHYLHAPTGEHHDN